MYAIVDIETTGGNTADNKIIEVAIYVHDGEKITNTYQKLINPKRSIPRFITSLTGINDAMVANAPSFEEVAKDIFNILQPNIFIAHNVNFDYSFLRNEFASAGIELNQKKLCTVRLSRQIFPGHKSYSLTNICNTLKITHTSKHRAEGDVKATVQLFELLLKNDKKELIERSLNSRSREALLPPYLKAEKFLSLPSSPGVYYFHNNKGKVIYVGKAIDLKKRVTSHFIQNSESRNKDGMINNIHDITYQVCGTELIALLLETHEIKRLWPIYNKALKAPERVFGIYQYEDGNGYLRLGINKTGKINTALTTFGSLADAKAYLTEVAKANNICMKLSGIQPAINECFDFTLSMCSGACIKLESANDHNAKVNNAIAEIKSNEQSLAIISNGRKKNEVSVVLNDRNKAIGFGYLKRSELNENYEDLLKHINFFTSNYDSKKIFSATLRKAENQKVVYFPA